MSPDRTRQFFYFILFVLEFNMRIEYSSFDHYIRTPM